MEKVGFLFGAGAEIAYGMPSGGKFALDIFRQNTDNAKEIFRSMRDQIDNSTLYASKWLPENYQNNKIHVFGERVYDTIIKDTVGNNRERVIEKINNFDSVAEAAIKVVNSELDIDLSKIIERDLGRTVENININQKLKYSKFFDEGNNLFANNYFAVLLEYYKVYLEDKSDEKKELGEIIKAVFQLQLGAMSEKISRTLEDNIFEKDELELDIFDDLGGSLNVNYEAAGVKGLELLAQEKAWKDDNHPIIKFAYEIIEWIYSDVLDYKSLIDSNWHYLYNPYTEWAKFCRISVFLYTVQEYIRKQGEGLDNNKEGYYHDLVNSGISKTVIATTNYCSFIKEILLDDIIFLNGGIDEYYDPYLNSIGSKEDLNNKEMHFLVPLIFTQSGTKPMTSIDMAKKYVDFYNKLKTSDCICSVGFGFNKDDEHINGIIRTLIDRDDKLLFIVDIDTEKDENVKRKEYAKKLKITKTNNLKFITVNKETRSKNNKLWIEFIKEYGND